MKIQEHSVNSKPNEIISESNLFESIKNYTNNNPTFSKNIVNKKLDLMKKINDQNIEKINGIISNIDSKIEQNNNNNKEAMIDIDYYIAKIRKQLNK